VRDRTGRHARPVSRLCHHVVAANRPVREVWRLGLGALVAPGDGSAALVPSVSWDFAENVELIANGLVSIGADGAEYGRGGVGGFVRGRVYF
jgi:hypothetical protein